MATSPYIQGGSISYPGGSSPANPNQFATPEEAARLAKLYGGTAFGQQLSGPEYAYSDPQQQLSIPGAPSPVNAGLASTYGSEYGEGAGTYGNYLVERDATGNYGQSPYDTKINPSAITQAKQNIINGLKAGQYVDPSYAATYGVRTTGYGYGGEMQPSQAQPAANASSLAPANQNMLVGAKPNAGAPPSGPGGIARPTPATPGGPQTPPRTSIPGTPGSAPAGPGQLQSSNVIRGRGGMNLSDQGTDAPDPYAGYFNLNPTYGQQMQEAETAAGWTQDANGQWVNSQDWTQQGLPQYGDPAGEWSQDPNTGQWIQGGAPPSAGGQPPASGGGPPVGGGTGFPPSGGGRAPNAGYPTFVNPYGSPQATNPYGYPGAIQPVYNQPNGEGLQYKTESDRTMAIQQGLGLQNDLQGYTNYQQGRANDYEGAANSAYGGIASGQGGRTDEEKAAIQQQGSLDAMQLSPDQANSNYLTDYEQAGISGDPYAPYRQLGTDEQSIDASTQGRNAAVRGAVGAGAAGIDSGLSGTATGVRDAIYDNRGKQYQNLSDAAALTRGAVDTGASNVRGALNYGEDTTRSYIDPAKLGLSDEYNRDYNFGERDMQNLRDKAGRSIGSQEAMDTERLLAGANASGNTSPLAIAAARAKIRQQGAVNQANAMSDAEIAGRRLQLDTTQQKENTRLGAEGNLANLGTGTELALGGRRAAAEQTLGAQNLQNEQNLTGETLATQNTLGAAEQGAEQYLGNQKQQAEQFKTTTNVGAEQALGAAGTEAEKFKTATNLGAGQTAEKAGSDRAAQIATNRQATNVGNQAADLARKQYSYGATAQNNTDFSNQRRADEGEYRGYLTNQGTQANQNAQVGNQQRLSAYGAQMGAQNAATGNAITNYKVPGTAEKALGAFGLAKGGVERGPTRALVGEEGPELIIDLGVPHYDGGGVVDPYAQQDYYGMGADTQPSPYGTDVMTGPRPAPRQLNPPNPFYEAIRRGLAQPGSPNGAYPTDTAATGGGLGKQLTSSLLSAGLKAAFGAAKGAVVKPGANPHHPWGKRGAPHVHGELVNGPQIKTLGQYGAQAVLPLNRKRGNNVTPEMIPELVEKYRGYGA